ENTMVLAIQNGLGSGARIANHIAHKHILLGVAQAFGASMKGPGHAHHNGMDQMRIGEMGGGNTDRLASVVDMWQSAGFNTEGYEDINRVIWEKFVCNVTLSAPCTVFNRTVIEMMNDPDAWSISLNCAKEAYAAGKAKGVAFSFDDPVAYVTAYAEKVPNARPSMLLDHLDKRRSEIDVINGMVPVVAREVGMTAPYNEVVSAIVRARENEF
ncbi:MAG: 2-dehydropantoate 2-reductase, partial [Hyphomicrobiales bacterium]|nr:2-dehydropantoate 2-reductase [Hyphomicrobiales bacterium]